MGKRKAKDFYKKDDDEEGGVFHDLKATNDVIPFSKKAKIEENIQKSKKESNTTLIKGFAPLGSSLSTVTDSTTIKSKDNKDITKKSTELSTFSNLIDSKLLDNLKTLNISSFFPVQTQVIPTILRKTTLHQDICVCAPTGSGKTLSYVLPIVQSLMNRVIIRIRCLVLVPTRDLAVQVKEIFEKIATGTDLKIFALMGQTSFELEQTYLKNSDNEDAFDIIISTPGRLVEHLEMSKEFDLQHLSFLVVDEADILLQQRAGGFQHWLPKVLNSIYKSEPGYIEEKDGGLKIKANNVRSIQPFRKNFQEQPMTKLLFSATMTQNPKKLFNLKLDNPIFFTPTSSESETKDNKFSGFTFPITLTQYAIVSNNNVKKWVLLVLLNKLGHIPILCFTNSIDSSHELYEFLKNYPQFRSVEYSSTLRQHQRNEIIESFKDGKIDIVVTTDVLARGLDVDGVQAVINYEFPMHIKGYIHRCGRTARAGNIGYAYSFVTIQQRDYLKGTIKEVNPTTNLNTFRYSQEEILQYKSSEDKSITEK